MRAMKREHKSGKSEKRGWRNAWYSGAIGLVNDLGWHLTWEVEEALDAPGPYSGRIGILLDWADERLFDS